MAYKVRVTVWTPPGPKGRRTVVKIDELDHEAMWDVFIAWALYCDELRRKVMVENQKLNFETRADAVDYLSRQEFELCHVASQWATARLKAGLEFPRAELSEGPRLSDTSDKTPCRHLERMVDCPDCDPTYKERGYKLSTDSEGYIRVKCDTCAGTGLVCPTCGAAASACDVCGKAMKPLKHAPGPDGLRCYDCELKGNQGRMVLYGQPGK